MTATQVLKAAEAANLVDSWSSSLSGVMWVITMSFLTFAGAVLLIWFLSHSLNMPEFIAKPLVLLSFIGACFVFGAGINREDERMVMLRADFEKWEIETVYPYLKQNEPKRLEVVEIFENDGNNLEYEFKYLEDGVTKPLKGNRAVIYDLEPGVKAYVEVFEFRESIGNYFRAGETISYVHLAKKLKP